MVTEEVTLSRQLDRDVSSMASRRNISPGEMACRALAVYDYLSRRQSNGDTILLRDRVTGETEEVLMGSWGYDVLRDP